MTDSKIEDLDDEIERLEKLIKIERLKKELNDLIGVELTDSKQAKADLMYEGQKGNPHTPVEWRPNCGYKVGDLVKFCGHIFESVEWPNVGRTPMDGSGTHPFWELLGDE